MRDFLDLDGALALFSSLDSSTGSLDDFAFSAGFFVELSLSMVGALSSSSPGDSTGSSADFAVVACFLVY